MCYNNNINIHCEAKCSLSGMYLLFESFYGSCSSFSNEQQTNVTEEVDLKSALFFSFRAKIYTQQVEGSICVRRRKCVSQIFSAASELL